MLLHMISPYSYGKNMVKTFLLGPNKQWYSQSLWVWPSSPDLRVAVPIEPIWVGFDHIFSLRVGASFVPEM